MNPINNKIVAFIFAIFSGSTALAATSCILYFDIPEDPFHQKMVAEISKATEETVFVDLAEPKDIVDCVKTHNVKELVIISHATLNPVTNSTRLGFYMKNEDPEKLRNTYIDMTKKKIEGLENIVKSRACQMGGQDRSCKKNLTELRDARYSWSVLAGMRPGELMYEKFFGYSLVQFFVGPFSIFRRLQKLLQESPEGYQLEKIRIMSCEQDKIREAYPEIFEMASDFNIEIEFAPPNSVLSFFMGKQVTSPDTAWVRKSIY